MSQAFQSTFGASRFWAFFSCFLVMCLPTFLMGASFPLVTKIYTGNARQIGAEYRKRLCDQHRWQYSGRVLCRVHPHTAARHPTEYRFDGSLEYGYRMFPCFQE